MSEWIDIPLGGDPRALTRVHANTPEARAWLARQPKPALQYGPGTELKKLLASMGIRPDASCSCNTRASEMDRWGVTGCRMHRDEIIGWLREGYVAWGWRDKLPPAVQANVAVIDPFPELVDEAIARAEAIAPIVVNLGAGGIGDALLGLCVLPMLAEKHRGRKIVYKTGASEWVNLFEGGYDHVGNHDHDNHPDKFCPDDIQMNLGYSDECRTHAAIVRWQRYAANLGVGSDFRLPKLRDPALVRRLGREAAGAVVLCPQSAWANRQWRIESSLTLERLLLDAGYRVIVLVADKQPHFKSQQFVRVPAAHAAGILMNAAVTVTSDSGMAHLGGLLGAKVVVTCGPTRGEQIFGLYPTVRVLQGKLDCDGCHWQVPYDVQRCDPSCANLTTILPEDVLAVIQRECPLPRTFPAAQLTGLFADADRAEAENWLPRYRVLWEAVREFAPRRIVEIGVRAGYSAWTMLDAAPDAWLIGIDADFDGVTVNSHGGYPGAWQHAVRICAGRDFRLMLADSHKLDRLPDCDLLYIDGDHDENGVWADLMLAERSGAPVILLDDYAVPNLGIKSAVDRFMVEHPMWRGKFRDNGSTGLYVIVR